MQASTLQNKVVLITGGSSGIGKALVENCIAAGAYVATCGRHLATLQQALQNLPAKQLLCIQADVSVQADCEAFVAKAFERFQQIDILINNAGMSMRALFQEVEVNVLQQLMDINFWGTVYCTKAALPHVLKTEGVIVGVSSIAGFRGLPGRSGYSASKFAMQGFLESLRTELLYSGTDVMWVSPGFTASNIRNAALNSVGVSQSETPLAEDKLMSSDEVAQVIIKAIIARKRTVVMTPQGKMAVWANKLFPAWTDKKVYDLFAAEPNSPLPKHKPNA